MLGFASLSAKVIAFNLIILIVLRAIWIGYVGLSSVFPQGIVPSKIQTSEFQRRKLTERYGDSNRHIIRLDKLSSTLFSFLIACFIFSMGVLLLLTVLLVYLGGNAGRNDQTLLQICYYALLFLLHSPSIAKLFNFVTLGCINKNPTGAKILYYLNWCYSWLTLYHLYAPVYYILISNYNRLKVKLLIGAYVAVILAMAAEITTEQDLYFPTQPVFDNSDYDNLRAKEYVIGSSALESDVIEKNYAKFFIRYQPADKPLVMERCPTLKDVPQKLRFQIFNAGLSTGGSKSAEQLKQYNNTALRCLSELHRISIDGKVLKELQFAWHIKDDNFSEKGFQTLLPMANLKPGLHTLTVEKATDAQENGNHSPYSSISFWKI